MSDSAGAAQSRARTFVAIDPTRE